MKALTVLAALLAGAGLASPAQAHTGCDRSCLIETGERFVDALVDRAPSRLDLAANVRFTENGQQMSLAEGVWANADRKGDYKIIVPDPVRQEVGIFVQVFESGQPALVAGRIKVDGRLISEIETMVSRYEEGGMGRQNQVKVRSAFLQDLAPSERVERYEMLHAADSYFVGLEQATDKLTPFGPDCIRVENGAQTTSNPDFGGDIPAMNCQEQFATGFSRFITGLRERRYLVDEQTGVVMAMLFFDHAGTWDTVTLANGEVMDVSPPFTSPFTFQIFELFKIKNGKINEIEAVLNSVPYKMLSGWMK